MALRVEQLFVKEANPDLVSRAVGEYVALYGKKFQHRKYSLEGVKQVLACLIQAKRSFLSYSRGEWTSIWEVVDHSEFADPAIAAFLAEKLRTTALWVKLDQDWNIWAYREHRGKKLVGEVFLPEADASGE